jgi:hypothetical protein
MNTTDDIAPDQLPEPIGDYLLAHRTRDAETAIRYFNPDGTVVDDGNTYRGSDEIRAWLATAASEYTYTTELTGAHRIDDDHYVATHHLEGNFPGGVVDLHFTFTLRDGRIAQLTIAP